MIDRVEISIIEEQQPRWLSFLNRQQDFMERLADEFVNDRGAERQARAEPRASSDIQAVPRARRPT